MYFFFFLVKEKLNEDADSEIATTSLRVSLACPLGKMRMSTPCRATTCSHLQCFDASLFLQMNERKPTWNCPVCDKPALYDNLTIDGYFQEVLVSNKLLPDVNEIQLLQDGSWENLVVKKENKDKEKSEKVESSASSKEVDVTVDLGKKFFFFLNLLLLLFFLKKCCIPDENQCTKTSSPSVPKEKKRALLIDLTTDSEDEDETITVSSSKRQAMGSPVKSQTNVNTSVISSTSDSPECMIIDLE